MPSLRLQCGPFPRAIAYFGFLVTWISCDALPLWIRKQQKRQVDACVRFLQGGCGRQCALRYLPWSEKMFSCLVFSSYLADYATSCFVGEFQSTRMAHFRTVCMVWHCDCEVQICQTTKSRSTSYFLVCFARRSSRFKSQPSYSLIRFASDSVVKAESLAAHGGNQLHETEVGLLSHLAHPR